MENTVNAQPVDNAVEKPYTLRPLRDEDLWPVLDIIGKVMPDQLSGIMADVMLKMENKDADTEKLMEEIGSEFVAKLLVSIVRKMNVARGEVYAFLSSVSGIPAAEIPGMPFGTTPRMIWDIVQSEVNADFFKVVSKLL